MTQSPQTPPKDVPPAKVKYDPEERANETLGPELSFKDPARVECAECGIFRPFTSFENGTDAICKECRSTLAEKELKEIRDNQFRKVSAAVIEGAKHPDAALPRLEMVFGEFMVNMGGPKVFAHLWATHFKQALANRPGSHGVLQMFHSIAKVNLELSKRQQQEDVIDLTDKQLQDRREMAQMKLLQDILADPGKVQMLQGVIKATQGNIRDIPGVAEKLEAAHADE